MIQVRHDERERAVERKRKAEGDGSEDEEVRERDADNDLERSGDRDRSLVRGIGERELKAQPDDRESWIWKWCRGVALRREELVGEQGCGEKKEKEALGGDGTPEVTKFWSVPWEDSEERNKQRTQ